MVSGQENDLAEGEPCGGSPTRWQCTYRWVGIADSGKGSRTVFPVNVAVYCLRGSQEGISASPIYRSSASDTPSLLTLRERLKYTQAIGWRHHPSSIRWPSRTAAKRQTLTVQQRRLVVVRR